MLKFSRLFKRAKKLGINVKLVILGLICVFVILPLVAFTVTMVSRPFQVVEKVTNPDRIVYTYEWFFNTYASAKSYALHFPQPCQLCTVLIAFQIARVVCLKCVYGGMGGL